MTSSELLEEKHRRMTTEPVRKLVLSMAVPTIISMAVTSIYNFADTWFISNIAEGSDRAIAATGVIFSYMSIVNATGFFFGHGSGNYMSRALGAHDMDGASRMSSTGFITSFLFGLLIAAAVLLCGDPFLYFIGASPSIIQETRDYFFYIAIATCFMTSSLVLNNQLRLQGNARRGMIGIGTGALLNIALDPLFIFGFDMGLSGASLATAISQTIGFFVLFWMTHSRDSIAPRLKNFSPSLARYREIAAGGLPSLARQSLNAIAAIVMNRYALGYGPEALASVSLVARILGFVFCIIVGLGQGFQPVCGFNYGAGRFDRVKEAYFETIKLSTAAVILCTIALYVFGSTLVGTFGSSSETASLSLRTLYYQLFSLPFIGFIVATEMMLQNTRQTIKASLLAMMRRGLAFAPCIIVLDAIFGLEGVLASKPAADYIALMFAIPFAVIMVRRFNRRISAQNVSAERAISAQNVSAERAISAQNVSS